MHTRELPKIVLIALLLTLAACGGDGSAPQDNEPVSSDPVGNDPGGSDPGTNDPEPEPEPDPVSDHAVRGSASGLVAAVAVELRLGDKTELLAVLRNGEFAFNARLEDGAPYTVVLSDPDQPCALRNQTGVVDGRDATIELMCTGASLEDVLVSGIVPQVSLVPDVTEYDVEIPLSQTAVSLTAIVAVEGDSITINGMPVASGTPSSSIPLNLGDNLVEVFVENDLGWQRSYRLNLRRAGRLAQYAYGKASNTGVDDQFGWSMALSGDTLAVGAPFEQSRATGVDGDQTDNGFLSSGAVYVFRRSGTIWRQEAYIKASNTGNGDDFGSSVALSNDLLAVGAPLENSAATGINGDQTSNAAGNSGAVYVFRRSGTTWQQETYIKASNAEPNDRFGISVSLEADTLAVGAHFEDSAATGVGGSQTNDPDFSSSGAVYVFRHSGEGWQQEAYIKASNTDFGDTFGASVTLSGDTLAVGAPFEDSKHLGVNADETDDSSTNSGAVYVFRRSGTEWQQEVYPKADAPDPDDRFGTSVALSGDALAVGVPREDSAATGVGSSPYNNSYQDSGAVYVFRRSGTVWRKDVYIKAATFNPGDQFGNSVALSGDTLVVGAYSEDSAATGVGGDQTNNESLESGAVYVFKRVGTIWRQSIYLKASNTDPDDWFGSSVAVSDDTIAVGAYFEDSMSTGMRGDQTDNSALDGGAVYIFH